MFAPENFNIQFAAAAVAFVICVIAYPFYIRWLKHKQVEQFIREEGPQSHAAKARTPTMGGLCFIFGVCVTSALFLFLFTPEMWGTSHRSYLALPMVVGLACSAIGFADDYGKVTSKSNKGLSARSRLFAELALGLALGLSLFLMPQLVDCTIILLNVPWTGAAHDILLGGSPNPGDTLPMLAPGWTAAYFLLLCPLVVAGTSNALNLHDGMDGLAGGTSTQVFACLAYMLWLGGKGGLAMIAAAVSGALLGFLCYNRYKAKVFMGDTGSLFLGGLLAALAICGGLTFWLIPLGLIYIVEAFSVMAQVAYFKLTKPYTGDPMPQWKLIVTKLTKRLPGEGKRLLRMAPIHHHFEAVYGDKGVKEWQVVSWFWIAQAVLCAVTIALFRL